MGSMSGQFGGKGGNSTPKIPGFSAKFVSRGPTVGKRLDRDSAGKYSIKSPRQARGSAGDGMNGGH